MSGTPKIRLVLGDQKTVNFFVKGAAPAAPATGGAVGASAADKAAMRNLVGEMFVHREDRVYAGAAVNLSTRKKS